jgi:hypothetical protein
MRCISAGHALVGWAETNSVMDESTNCWPEVEAIVMKHQEASISLQEALQKPAFGFSLKYQEGFSLLLGHLSQIKRASVWLSVAATLAMHEGDTSNAWNNLEAETELVGKDRGEPMIISQLVRIAMTQIAIATTWEALQYPHWNEEQLARLQKSWDSFDLTDQLDASISMERVIGGIEVVKMRNSYSNFNNTVNPAYFGGTTPRYDDLGQVLANPVEGVKAHLRYRAWKFVGSYDEEIYVGQIWQAALAAVRQARTNNVFVPALNNFNQTVTNIQKANPGWEYRFPFGNAETSWASSSLLKVADTETARRIVVTAIALERYRLRKGKYPARLEELTPDYLAKTPIDFMDGKPLRYRRKNDGAFLLYSVGEDGKDDGGDASPPQTDSSTYKIWYKMRDAVWPTRATAEEVAKYEAVMLQKIIKELPGKLVPQIVPEPGSKNSNTN